ncbi:hypothetical protein MBLNU230_g2058t1 [Neophaeotheca triangularis]
MQKLKMLTFHLIGAFLAVTTSSAAASTEPKILINAPTPAILELANTAQVALAHSTTGTAIFATTYPISERDPGIGECVRICNAMGPRGRCVGPKKCIQDGVVYLLKNKPDATIKIREAKCKPICESFGPDGVCVRQYHGKCIENGVVYDVEDAPAKKNKALLVRDLDCATVCEAIGPSGECLGLKRCEMDGTLYDVEGESATESVGVQKATCTPVCISMNRDGKCEELQGCGYSVKAVTMPGQNDGTSMVRGTGVHAARAAVVLVAGALLGAGMVVY